MSAVLLVEDEDVIREAIASVLREEGYAVVTARNGVEALDVMMTRPLCLVLLDLMMPQMDGWEFRRRMLAAGGRPVPVVIMSGAGDLEASTRHLKPAAILQKPFGLGKVVELVASFCVASPALTNLAASTMTTSLPEPRVALTLRAPHAASSRAARDGGADARERQAMHGTCRRGSEERVDDDGARGAQLDAARLLAAQRPCGELADGDCIAEELDDGSLSEAHRVLAGGRGLVASDRDVPRGDERRGRPGRYHSRSDAGRQRRVTRLLPELT